MKYFIGLLILVMASASCMSSKRAEKKALESFESVGLTVRLETKHIGSHHVHYAVSGGESLPTLIFIHGSPGGWEDYSQFMKDPDILLKYRVVSVDRPGFGASDFGKAHHLQESVEIISLIIPDLQNGEPMYWIGHSLGGPFVVMMAKLHPEFVSGIGILAGAVSPMEEAPEYWRYILNVRQIRWLIPTKLRTSNQELIYFKKDIYALGEDWSDIVIPVLIVHGTDDPLVNYANANYAKSKLLSNQKTSLVSIKGANHYLPWKYYGQVKSSILDFFLTN